MAIYSANKPNRTLTLHKDGCKHISTQKGMQPCGCGPTGSQGNQQWWCESHMNRNDVDTFMKNRFWSILVCDQCY
jgi:hypothetical protein